MPLLLKFWQEKPKNRLHIIAKARCIWGHPLCCVESPISLLTIKLEEHQLRFILRMSKQALIPLDIIGHFKLGSLQETTSFIMTAELTITVTCTLIIRWYAKKLNPRQANWPNIKKKMHKTHKKTKLENCSHLVRTRHSSLFRMLSIGGDMTGQYVYSPGAGCKVQNLQRSAV